MLCMHHIVCGKRRQRKLYRQIYIAKFLGKLLSRLSSLRGCLHDIGATFIPARVHSGSLLWLCIRLHDTNTKCHACASHTGASSPPGGGGVLPYKGLMGTCGQPGYVFQDFCLKQGIDLSIFVLNRMSFLGR